MPNQTVKNARDDDPESLALPDLEDWSTVRPASTPGALPEQILLAPDGSNRRQIERELRRLEPDRQARVIGRGVTETGFWGGRLPEHSATLTFTEVDAYLPGRRTGLTDAMARDAERWLGDLLAGAVSGVDSGKALWGSAFHRFLRPFFLAWPLVKGLTARHPRAHFVCLEPAWSGLPAIAAELDRTGGTLTPRPFALPFWRLRMAGHLAAGVAATFVYRTAEFARERRGREHLNHLRSQHAGNPRVWAGVMGDWPRTCRHVVSAVSLAAEETGEGIGLLLLNSLLPGLRKELDTHGHSGSTVFPTLQNAQLEHHVVAVEQCAVVESLVPLLVNLSGSLATGLRIGARLIRSGPVTALGSVPVSMNNALGGLARLLTMDITRARESAIAARRFSLDRDLSKARIVLPHSSLANTATPDLCLQKAGATTYDLVHGSLAEAVDMVTNARTHSSYKVLWTEEEVRYLASVTTHQGSVGGYVPRPPAVTSPKPDISTRPVRLLAVSNYIGGVEFYEEQFFNAVSGAVRSSELDLDVKWRPHPSSDSEIVSRILNNSTLRDVVDVSLDPDGLAADLDWADIVVSSLSSSVVEAARYPAALYIHDVPLHERDLLSIFADHRRFTDSETLADQLREVVRELRTGGPDSLEEERILRTRLFGPSGKSKPIASLLWP